MIFIITGGVGEGKTRLLKEILAVLRDSGDSPSGFSSERIFEEGELSGYDLLAADGSRRVPFQRRAGAPGAESVGPWFLDRDGLAAAAEMIGAGDPDSVLAVDELGPLEIEGQGHWPAVAAALGRPGRRFLFIIRDSCLDDYRRAFRGRPMKIFPVRAKMAPEEIAREIIAHGRPS